MKKKKRRGFCTGINGTFSDRPRWLNEKGLTNNYELVNEIHSLVGSQ